MFYRIKRGLQLTQFIAFLVLVYFRWEDPPVNLVWLFFSMMALHCLINLAPISRWWNAKDVPRYHFHRNITPYAPPPHLKQLPPPTAPAPSSSSSDKPKDRSGAYSPIDTQSEVVKVKFLNPLFGYEEAPNKDGEELETKKGKQKESEKEDGDDLIVNPGFRFEPSASVSYHDIWIKDFILKDLAGEPLCWVRHPVLGLELPVQGMSKSVKLMRLSSHTCLTQWHPGGFIIPKGQHPKWCW